MTERDALSDDQIRRLLEMRARRADRTGLVEAISAEVAGEPQRSWHVDFRALGWVAAVAAVVVIAVGGAALLPRGPSGTGSVGGSASPSALPSASESSSPTMASPAPTGQPLAPAGLDAPPMAAGRWSTVAFRPGVSFTVPAGRWSPGLDLPQQVYLRAHLLAAPTDEIDAVTIVRLEDVYDDPCGQGPSGRTKPWSGGADAFIQWLQERSPVDLGSVSHATVLGKPALQIELEVPAGAYSTCSEGYLPIGEIAGGPSGQIAIPRIGQRFRLSTVDVDGGTLLILTFGSPQRWDALVAAADQVLATVQFQ
jgi:hypothetical protein